MVLRYHRVGVVVRVAQLDVYEVRMHSTFLGVDCFNLFFYQATGDDPAVNFSQQLAQNFQSFFGLGDTSGAFANNAFVAAWQYVSVSVRNLFNVVEIGGILHGATNIGTATTVRMPSWAAYRFICPRLRGDMRNGQKFFPGLPEDYGDDGNVSAANKTLLANLVTALGDVVDAEVGADTISFVPVIVKRIKEVDPQTLKVTYRLPETLAEASLYTATTWSLADRITTMNSRKS